MTGHLLTLVATLTFLGGCVSYPKSTGFVAAPSQGGEGYSIKTGSESLTAVYKGNAHTSSVDAMRFAIASAMEHCLGRGQTPMIKTPVDSSQTSQYRGHRTIQMPIYSQGRIVSYTSQSYPISYSETTPEWSVEFTCRKNPKAFGFGNPSKPVSAEMVHVFTKDFKGGLKVDKNDIGAGSPFLENDVLIAIAGKRVTSPAERDSVLDGMTISDRIKTVPARIVRDGKLMDITVDVVDITNLVKENATKLADIVCTGVTGEERKNNLGMTRPTEYPALCQGSIDKARAKAN